MMKMKIGMRTRMRKGLKAWICEGRTENSKGVPPKNVRFMRSAWKTNRDAVWSNRHQKIPRKRTIGRSLPMALTQIYTSKLREQCGKMHKQTALKFWH